ncbi:MAG: hypothetical protein A3C82_01875 [Candidatus Wildermuthbacteria bacterium RIFCSPHIGHO2_02_FULL_47_12]|uniref:Endolytic murein transglycosylase n=1 Tax=Candidatus Wildermuthbacteria bacterium RIFCSPHIGHO2_02_FULL_47_12 TaxID=1802451 RepID=A0A1G2R135_9BACT|nr:MAG: hypothetical protein A3C82_01875 [Candidatus Wildermuthbacteria bacterium RIFCSPHIGHO2_02_FULL_47_12]
MTPKTKTALCLGIVLFAAILLGIFAPIDRTSSKEIIFPIAKGEGSREIGYNLQEQGLIRFSPLFRIYTLTTRVSFRLQAGDYLLSPAMSMFDMVRKFTTGDVIQEKLTIVEGWNIQDIEEYFAKKGRAIEIPQDLEGYLFPDTYHVSSRASNEEIIAMARENFDKKFNADLRQETARQGKTIHDVVTMASLIEKEVQTIEDKQLVSGVLWKRLGIGMALQVDAAPITYRERGLPQNPIANPGLDSLKASLYPKENPYWYYLSTPEGKTIFSKTLEEHNIAKARYLNK